MNEMAKDRGQMAGFKDYLKNRGFLSILSAIQEEPTFADAMNALGEEDSFELSRLWTNYLSPVEPLTEHDYRMCLQAQDAVNLSGVVQEFARILPKIWDSLEVPSTSAVNHHPLCVLYSDKLASLAGIQGFSAITMDRYHQAYQAVKAGAGK